MKGVTVRQRKCVSLLMAVILVASICLGLSGCGAKKPVRYEATFLRLFDTKTTIIAYTYDKEEFSGHAQLIYDSLAAHRGRHAGAQAVIRLILRVRTFGFHLARLDVRQDSRVHDDILAALLADPAWAARDAAERAARSPTFPTPKQQTTDNGQRTTDHLQ